MSDMTGFRLGGLTGRALLSGSGAALAALGFTGAAGAAVDVLEATAGAMPAEREMEQEGLERLIQFVHPQKFFGHLPGFENDEILADVDGVPSTPEFLLPVGFHPSLEGHMAIVKALVERLAA